MAERTHWDWTTLPAGRLLAFLLLMLSLLHGQVRSADRQLESWHEVIRQLPYYQTQGIFKNLSRIREWVLLGSGYCEGSERHLLFTASGEFLSYLADADSDSATQDKLNRVRRQLAASGRLQAWVPGSSRTIGYPFALACNTRHFDLQAALAGILGDDPANRLWGTWDGISVGSTAQPVSLAAAIAQVYRQRKQQGRLNFPEEVLSLLLGQLVIESSGNKMARSGANALGIMQLLPAVLKDCEVPRQYWFHRIAQIDCALRLTEQNHRILSPLFEARFGSLPVAKKTTLYHLLLLQSYHAGIGRMRELLDDSLTGKAAAWYVSRQRHFSAEDIALSLILHNLGRRELGMASLYYMVDVSLATRSFNKTRLPTATP